MQAAATVKTIREYKSAAMVGELEFGKLRPRARPTCFLPVIQEQESQPSFPGAPAWPELAE